MILTQLFKLATDKTIHRKKYCRAFMTRRMVMFVKKTLPFVNFKEMISAVCKLQDKIRWRAVREMVSEVFTDIRAEEGMCYSANMLV